MLSVLLVDDEVFFRQGLRTIIDWEACGFEVIGEQDNGEDAYHFIMKERPDVVITDIRMPEVDGLQLIHKVIQEEQLKTKFIIVSGYDEFKYAQQAVRYGVCDFLLKPIDEMALQETLQQLADTIKLESQKNRQSMTHQNQELLAKIERAELSEEELREIYADMGLDCSEGHYYVLIEHSLDAAAVKQDYYPADQIQHMITIIQSLIPGITIRLMFSQRGRFGFIIPQSFIQKNSSIQTLMKQLYNRLSAQQQPLHIYFSDKCTGVHFFWQAYQAALHAARYKYIDNRKLFDFEELNRYELRHIMLPFEAYKGLLNEIEQNNDTGIERELDELLKQFGQQHCSVEAVKATVHKLVADCLHIVQTMQIDKNRLAHLNELIGLEATYVDRVTLRQLLLSFVLDCGRCIAEERKDMAKGGVQRIKKYIDLHFAEPISLKSIAAQFYINPVYLGQLFKKNYGHYFNEYLLQLRIQEAKKLLRQTDMKIYEIAEKVGFSHSEYFVSQFEKLEKLSPTAYRQTFKSNQVGEVNENR